jgi:UDP:flavonoid glycosyltransferase YjiC (YdhE family)
VRALFTSTQGAGHFHPLVPFARAFERAGHEVMFAGPPVLEQSVDAAGFRFWRFDSPADEELGPIWAHVPELSPDEANVVVIRDIFGRLNTTAALPGLRAAVEEWRPDVILRDPNEYGGAVAAETYGIPHARVAICLASSEELALNLARGPVDAIRRAEALPPDPEGEAMRGSPWLTTFPAGLDEGEMPDTHRFHDPAWDEQPKELPDWWPGREEQPLVYVTFGSVAGQFPQALPAYGVALSAVAELPARVLLTVGRDLDVSALPEIPDNVHVEPWVPQQDVLAHADAAMVHGGSGSTLGALAFGVPLVVIPLFADQPYNARRVAEVGAGLSVEPNRDDIPATIAPVRAAIEAVLSEPSYGDRARELAAEVRAEPPVDAAVPLLQRLGRR